MEVSKGVPTATLYLELGVLPISFEIELKQLLYLKHILDNGQMMSLAFERSTVSPLVMRT